MADLIERGLLIKKMQKPEIEIYDGQDYADWYSDCVQNAPTVDAVPVVRCKDCKHAWHTADGYMRCEKWGNANADPYIENDDFCSYGERKGR